MSPRSQARRLLPLVTAAILLLGAPRARAELTDRILSVVGDDVITLSELAIEEALRGVDISPVPPFRDPGRDTLELVEDQHILRAMAGDIRIFQPDRRQVLDRVAAIRERLVARGRWLDFLSESGLSEGDLEALVRGRMTAEIAVQRYVGLGVLSSYPEAGGAQDAAYGQAYDAWMAERRQQFSVRRVALRGEP